DRDPRDQRRRRRPVTRTAAVTRQCHNPHNTPTEGCHSMSTRENTLAVVLLVLIFLGGGGVLGYMLILDPLWEEETAAKTLTKEAEGLEVTATKRKKDVPRPAVANKRSLPTDQSLATREYSAMLERLVRQAYNNHTPNTVPPGLNITTVTITEPRAAT